MNGTDMAARREINDLKEQMMAMNERLAASTEQHQQTAARRAQAAEGRATGEPPWVALEDSMKRLETTLMALVSQSQQKVPAQVQPQTSQAEADAHAPPHARVLSQQVRFGETSTLGTTTRLPASASGPPAITHLHTGYGPIIPDMAQLSFIYAPPLQGKAQSTGRTTRYMAPSPFYSANLQRTYTAHSPQDRGLSLSLSWSRNADARQQSSSLITPKPAQSEPELTPTEAPTEPNPDASQIEQQQPIDSPKTEELEQATVLSVFEMELHRAAEPNGSELKKLESSPALPKVEPVDQSTADDAGDGDHSVPPELPPDAIRALTMYRSKVRYLQDASMTGDIERYVWRVPISRCKTMTEATALDDMAESIYELAHLHLSHKWHCDVFRALPARSALTTPYALVIVVKLAELADHTSTRDEGHLALVEQWQERVASLPRCVHGLVPTKVVPSMISDYRSSHVEKEIYENVRGIMLCDIDAAIRSLATKRGREVKGDKRKARSDDDEPEPQAKKAKRARKAKKQGKQPSKGAEEQDKQPVRGKKTKGRNRQQQK
ncbi:hypothetical protein LTR53_012791 [Teratosphaeriaceae sp. CCFEE 6253]|nr:hypothetical protein LTR53_012791 [Teratosphaeriaceae sp. CCFEE 6253]